MKWILDNGHGGVDENGVYTTCPNYIDGKPETYHKMHIHPNGLKVFEGEFNRMVVDRIANLLAYYDVDYHLLVPTYEDVSLRERVEEVNRLEEEFGDCVLVSIHGNAFNTKAEGIEVFTSKGQTRSDSYAEIFIDEAEYMFPDQKIRKDLTDGDKDKEANFYLLRKPKCPAILTENFFFDNLENAKFMLSDEGLDKIAQYHVEAILRIENAQL